jgi:3-oxoacyl-[acyl-carrier-protein] synthase-1
VYVAGIGAACAAGIGIAQISAALRASVNVFASEPSFPSQTNGSPMLLATAEVLDIHLPWQDRLAWFVDQALGQLNPPLELLLDAGVWDSELPHLPLILSLPPPRPGMSPQAPAHIVRRISRALKLPVDPHQSAMIRSAHDGALCGLGLAGRILSVKEPALVLVGGVDSWITIEALHELEAQRRLKCAGAPNGVIPGEGAAFLLLANEALASRAGIDSGIVVLAHSRETEPNPWYEQRPCLGEGLTRALRSVFTRAEHQVRTDITFNDLNGEPWRADEWAMAYLRTQAFHSEPLNLWHPADTWGDTAAAAGALLSALAAHELSRDRALERALVWCASDMTPYRSAALLARTHGG